MSIRKISIDGYRTLQNFELEISGINIITGPNGCGKSNLYKALNLLAQAVNGNFAEALVNEGGMPSIMWAGDRLSYCRSKAPVRVTLSVTMEDYTYELISGLPKTFQSKFALDPEIKEEHVYFGSAKRKSTCLLERKAAVAWLMNPENKFVNYPLSLTESESVLAQIREPHLYPELFRLKEELNGWRFYHFFRTDQDSPLRYPQVGTFSPILNNAGTNLAAALQTIVEIGDHDRLHQAINDAFPNTQLIIQGDEKSRFEVLLKQQGINRPLEAKELSDGTLHYLCLIAALLSPRPPNFLVLNEPETSLHPDLIEPLSYLICDAAKYSQIWITTHSEKLANMLSEISGRQIIQLEKVDGKTSWVNELS